MMRVVHVLCDLSGGGAERLVLDLCRRISDVEQSVLAVHAGGELEPAFRAAGVPVACVGRRRKRLGGRALLEISTAFRGADIVHTHLWAGDTWGRLAALAHPTTPVVTTEHNVRGEAGWWRAGVDRLLLRRTTHFVAVSEAAVCALEQRGVAPPRISQIDNGIDLARFPARPPMPEPEDGQYEVLAVGRLVPQKGFDLLVQAVAGLPVSLTIVGDGPDRDALRRQALAEGVALHLPGWETDPWCRPAHLAVIPSRWEGFGLVAIEALASGLPVLVSDAAPLPRLVGAAGAVAPRDSAEGLRAVLVGLLSEGRRRRALAAAAPARSCAFSIETTASRYRELYARLLAGERARP